MTDAPTEATEDFDAEAAAIAEAAINHCIAEIIIPGIEHIRERLAGIRIDGDTALVLFREALVRTLNHTEADQ